MADVDRSSVPATSAQKDRRPMKRSFASGLLSTVLVLLSLPPARASDPPPAPPSFGPLLELAPPDEWLGKNVPDGLLAFLDGSSHRLSAHAGRNLVVLHLWSTTCPSSSAALPLLAQAAAHGSASNVAFYAIAQDPDPQAVRDFLRLHPVDLPVALDADGWTEGLALAPLPRLFVLDASGKVQFVLDGPRPDLPALLDRVLAQLRAGEPLAERALQQWTVYQHPEALPPDAYPPRPIPAGPDAPTRRDFRADEAAFAHRVFTDLYLRTRASSAHEADLLAFFADYERMVAGSDDPVPSTREFIDRALALRASGADHPLLAYCLGALHRELATPEGYEDSQRETRAAFTAFSSPPFQSAWRRYGCAMRMIWNLHDTRQANAHSSWHAQLSRDALAALQESLCDGTFSNISLRIPLRELRLALDNDLDTHIPLEDYRTALLAVSNRIPAPLLHFTLAWCDERAAWKSNTRRPTRSDAPQASFRQTMSNAYEHALLAWQDAPTPEVATLLIKIAKNNVGPDNACRLWFDRAVERQLDHMPAYRAFRVSLQPMWGGSPRLMLDFGEECLATRRFDTPVPDFYSEIVKSISMDSDHRLAIFRRPGVCSNWVALFDDYQAANPDNPRTRDNRRTLQAIALWGAGRPAEAAERLTPLNGIPTDQPLQWFRIHPPLMRGELALLNGPRRDAFLGALASSRAGHHAQARDLLDPLRHTPGLDDMERYRLEEAFLLSRIRADLPSGQPVPLMPAFDLAGWHPLNGPWFRRADGALHCPGRSLDRSKLTLKTPLGLPLEITGEIELKGPRDSGELFLDPLRPEDSVLGVSLRFSRGSQTVGLCPDHRQGMSAPARLGPRNSFRILLDGRRITLDVNGQTLAQDWKIPDNLTPNNDVTVGLKNIRNFAVRQLAARTPANIED